MAKTLANWEETEKVTEAVSKKFNVVLKTEFESDFIEKCYGEGNMTYVDPNKDIFEANKARREAAMTPKEYIKWKTDIENSSRVITVKNIEYHIKSVEKSDYFIFDSKKLK